MSSSSSSSSDISIGSTGVLTVTFVVLKLTHVIDWPWVWVLAPLWIGAIITVIFLIIILVWAWILSRRNDLW